MNLSPNLHLCLTLIFRILLQYRPLVWRNTHPYIVVDRHEDITHPNKISEDPACDRSVTFYGYVRGTHLKPSTKMHLIGVGDFHMAELSVMPDPCPLPDKEKTSQVRVVPTLLHRCHCTSIQLCSDLVSPPSLSTRKTVSFMPLRQMLGLFHLIKTLYILI